MQDAVLAARGWENDGRDAVLDKAVTLTGDAEVGFGANGDFYWEESTSMNLMGV